MGVVGEISAVFPRFGTCARIMVINTCQSLEMRSKQRRALDTDWFSEKVESEHEPIS